ncbi:hypothetical protein [Pseudonocardia sp. ICBG1293]|uniref:hypothetical protein n=1 Tax=Pseudonocardia sp. ICBG1293 TaxID=2844382 RepID=UPI001CCB25A8|nr:hypothetical protein [Pseudonocardia sp. ICBG1293]
MHGIGFAVVAVVCGLVSIFTATEYRTDWTAVVGATAGAGQIVLSIVLLLV